MSNVISGTPSHNPSTISNRRFRLAVFSYFCCTGITFASWASRIPTIKADLGLSEGQLGTMLLMLPLGQLFTLPLSGKLVTRFGSAKVLSIMCLIYGALLVSISFATSIYILAPTLMLFGIASNMCNIAVNTQAVGVEKLYSKSIMTTFHGGWSLAGFTGALIGLITLQFNLSTTTHFLFILGILIVNTLWNVRYLLPQDVQPENQSGKERFRPDRILIQLGIIGFFSMATEGAMFDWSGVYFQEIVNAPEKLIILGYTAFMIMMATGRFVGDFMLTRFGYKKVLMISGSLMFIGMISSVLFPNLVVATISFMLVGLGVACCVPTVYSLAGKHPSISPGMALALVSSISFLGFLMGPPLIGYIAELFNLSWSFTLFSLFGLAMVIIVGRSKVFNVFKN